MYDPWWARRWYWLVLRPGNIWIKFELSPQRNSNRNSARRHCLKVAIKRNRANAMNTVITQAVLLCSLNIIIIFSRRLKSEIGKLFELSSTSWFEILFERVSTSTQIFSGLVGLVLFSTETGSKLVEKKLFSTKILRNIIWDWFKNIEPVFLYQIFY